MYTEADIRLHLDAKGFVPFIGKEDTADIYYKKKRVLKEKQLAQRELDRRKRDYERLGYERQIMRKPRRDGPTVDHIIAAVALAFSIPREDLLTRSRAQKLVNARHVLAWELRQRKHFTVTKIGEMLDRDHTTITHSIQLMHHNRHRFEKEVRTISHLLDV